MLSNSLAFVKFLIPAVVFYYALPPPRRKGGLLLLSYIFYGLWNLPYLLLLIVLTAIAYAWGLMIAAAPTPAQKRNILAGVVTFLLGALALFKYAGALGALFSLIGLPAAPLSYFERILIPLGISYYTFKLISYVIDVYWGKIPAERDPAPFALYPAFFPQILSGPIQRAGDFLPQVKRAIPNDPALITSGLRLMLFGYFKKMVIADSLALVVAKVYADPGGYNSAAVLLACYAFVI